MTVGKIQPLFTSTDMYATSSHPNNYRNTGNRLHTESDLQMENDSYISNEPFRRGQLLGKKHHQSKEQSNHVLGGTSTVPIFNTSVHQIGNESGLLENVTKKMTASSSNPGQNDYNDVMLEFDNENDSVSMLKVFVSSDAYTMGKF